MARALVERKGDFLGVGSALSVCVFDPEKKQRFLKLAKKFWPNVSKCCRAVGISNQTYYNHLNKDSKFLAEVMQIKSEKLDHLEEVAMKSGSTRKGFLDRAMVLRAHRPELYDRARKVIVEGGLMSNDEARKRLGVARKFVDAEIVGEALTKQDRKALKRGGMEQGGAGDGVGGGGGKQ